MTLLQLLNALRAHEIAVPPNVAVKLIVNGIAYPVDDVWVEPNQGGKAAICIGEDPR